MNGGMVPVDLWTHKDTGTTDQGSKELETLLDGKYFDFPKPSSLIKRALKIITSEDKEALILDFFAGTSPTAHAIIDLNKEDGGNRKFICVQLPEQCYPKSEAYKAGFQTIADISKERIRRVIKKIKQEQEGQIDFGEGKQDLGFKVFRLSESNFKQWQPKPKDAAALAEQIKMFVNPMNGKPTDEAMAFELLLKSGLDLNSKIEEKEGYYLINESELALVLSETTEDTFNKISAAKPSKVIALDTAFKDNDQLKTNVALQLKDSGVDFKTV